MLKFSARPFSFLSAFVACSVMALATGCASGGFKLTREYAGFVNSQNVIVRVILYILTSIVFAVTMLVDLVIFNTMDFWEGKVSAGTYNFNQGDRTYVVQHELQNGTALKRSTIRVMDTHQTLLQEVVLLETPSGEIEMYVDQKLRSRVRGLSQLPVVSLYDKAGHQTDEQFLVLPAALAMNR